MVVVVIVREGHDAESEVEADRVDDDGWVEAFDGGREEVGLEGGDAGSEVWVCVLAWGRTRVCVKTRDVRGGWLELRRGERDVAESRYITYSGWVEPGPASASFPWQLWGDVMAVDLSFLNRQSIFNFVKLDDTPCPACPPAAILSYTIYTNEIKYSSSGSTHASTKLGWFSGGVSSGACRTSHRGSRSVKPALNTACGGQPFLKRLKTRYGSARPG